MEQNPGMVAGTGGPESWVQAGPGGEGAQLGVGAAPWVWAPHHDPPDADTQQMLRCYVLGGLRPLPTSAPGAKPHPETDCPESG